MEKPRNLRHAVKMAIDIAVTGRVDHEGEFSYEDLLEFLDGVTVTFRDCDDGTLYSVQGPSIPTMGNRSAREDSAITAYWEDSAGGWSCLVGS